MIVIFQMDLDEVVIHDTALGVNIFMPIVTGTKLERLACSLIKLAFVFDLLRLDNDRLDR